MNFAKTLSRKKIGIALVALLGTLPLIYAQKGDQHGGENSRETGSSHASEPMRAPVPQHAASEERVTHGSLRHVDTVAVKRPEPVAHDVEVHHDVVVHHDVDVHHDVIVHRDVEAEYSHTHFWNGFVYGARFHALPLGCLTIRVRGVPYFYNDGIYYQPYEGGYQEVYPPVGAQVTEPPDGAVVVYAGNLAYYFAGGAFYVQQDGGYVIAPTPIGVIVPELPPGAVQVSLNGGVAYQFNGIYYQPVFVNGVTQYQTING